MSLDFLSQLYGQDPNDRKAREQMKERLQIIFPELLFLSVKNNSPQIVVAKINNILCTYFIHSSKENMFWFIADEVWTRIKNIYTTLLVNKTKRSSFHQTDHHQSLCEKISRAASAKHISYNWGNAETIYLVIITGYCSFNIQRNLFHS